MEKYFYKTLLRVSGSLEEHKDFVLPCQVLGGVEETLTGRKESLSTLKSGYRRAQRNRSRFATFHRRSLCGGCAGP